MLAVEIRTVGVRERSRRNPAMFPLMQSREQSCFCSFFFSSYVFTFGQYEMETRLNNTYDRRARKPCRQEDTLGSAALQSYPQGLMTNSLGSNKNELKSL